MGMKVVTNMWQHNKEGLIGERGGGAVNWTRTVRSCRRIEVSGSTPVTHGQGSHRAGGGAVGGE